MAMMPAAVVPAMFGAGIAGAGFRHRAANSLHSKKWRIDFQLAQCRGTTQGAFGKISLKPILCTGVGQDKSCCAQGSKWTFALLFRQFVLAVLKSQSGLNCFVIGGALGEAVYRKQSLFSGLAHQRKI